MYEISGKTTVGKVKVKLENKDQFIRDLIQLVDSVENKQSINTVIYNKLLTLGVNKFTLDQMVERIKVCASYDDNESHINFPYEDWIPKLLEYYTGEIK